MLFGAFVVLFLFLWAFAAAALPLLQRGGAFAAHLISRASGRWTPTLIGRAEAFAPVVLLVVVGALFTAWAGDQFLDLAEMVRANNPAVRHVDTSVHDWALSERSSGSTAFFLLMTTIGSPAAITAIGICVGIALLITRRYRWVAYLAVTSIGGGLLDSELKRYFARARPDVAEMLRHASGYSFPSGHAMGSTVMFGALSYFAFRLIGRLRWRAAAVALASTLILSIAASRVYLGVHWITDVVAGIAAGLMWVAITTVSYETFRRIRLLRTTAK